MTESTPEQFDPSAHTVDEVNAYLAEQDEQGDEFARVILAEQDGKARVGILGDPATPNSAVGRVLRGADSPEEPQEPQEDPDAANGPETGAQDVSTAGATFPEAVEAMAEVPEPVGRYVTSTDALAARGESKGLTFAEQAEHARALYGNGNPAAQEG